MIAVCWLCSFHDCVFFFFKQKTSYEMLISDWSSDVCASDLDSDPMIVADWPDDLAYFCHLLVTGPGEMIAIGGLRLELINGSGFSAAANSKIPHNALHDARALKDFCLDSAY